LRAIEEKVYERVGGGAIIKANVRIVASTKCNLLDKIGAGTFREDLFYRLDVLRINIPVLRKRRDDIPLLVEHLLKQIAQGRDLQIDPDALDMLSRHDWPGNVRELLHTLQRAYLVGGGNITAELLGAEMGGHSQDPDPRGRGGDFQEMMDKTERELLARALTASGGNKTAAAASLGMKPSTFRDKLARHGLA
jgi:DNA-binding NtrC family response regulator